MSLLSTENRVLLLPGRALMRQGGRLMEAGRGPGWDGALAGLEALLQSRRGGRGLDIRLSHHFAGLHLLPPPPLRLGADEMQGWLGERLAADFGAEVQAWRLAWQDVPPGRAVPVASLPAERHQALMDRLLAAGVKPRHVAPWFVSAWSRHHRSVGRGPGWLALAEPGRLALARVAGGRPASLAMSRLEADAPLVGQLVAAVGRLALHAGVPAQGEVWLLAPEGGADENAGGPALRLHLLSGRASGWEAELA